MTTRVFKGGAWTLAGQLGPVAVSLVTTPLVIRMLHAEGYGVLVLVGLIPGYLSFADLGMGLASTKFAAEAFARSDHEREARIVRTAALISLLTSVPIAVVIFVSAGWLASQLNVPAGLYQESVLALRASAFAFVLNFLNNILNTPQLTRLRMDLNALVTGGVRIAGLIATPIVVYLGGGILGAVLVLLAVSVFTFLGHVVVSRRLLPELMSREVDSTAGRMLLRFGMAIAFGGIAGILLTNIEKLALARLASVATLGYYSVAFTFATMITRSEEHTSELQSH